MDILFHVPINRVSFGQVSYNLMMEAKRQGHRVFFVPIGPVDLTTMNPAEEIKEWFKGILNDTAINLNPEARGIKLWHLATSEESIGYRGSYERFCYKTTFLSFYELDSPTPLELNVARQFDTVFSSNYTCEVFKGAGVSCRFVPLAFDSATFFPIDKKYFNDDRIAFSLLGKFENRKHHQKIIRAWIKRFGNNKRYYLQCAIYNPFFSPQMNTNLLISSMEGKHFWNVNPVPWSQTNQAYNDFLNSNHIVIGMSGGEGWGLPEFHSVGLGKHAVILNAHSYKDWANDKNAVLISPLDKISSVDGVFFRKDVPVNQGNIFSWDDDEFINGCEMAIERYNQNPVNKEGLKLKNEFTYTKTLNMLINK